MPQLDFTIWLIKLTICWGAFFLVYTTTNKITNSTSVKGHGEKINIQRNKWPW